MTSSSASLPVLNSLLFIADSRTRDVPEIDGRGDVWSTPSCVAVACLPDCDGETKVTIGPAHEVEQPDRPLFEGLLNTPSRKVIVATVLREIVLEKDVSKLWTRVRIWTDGSRDTDKVIVGLE